MLGIVRRYYNKQTDDWGATHVVIRCKLRIIFCTMERNVPILSSYAPFTDCMKSPIVEL